LRPRKSQNSEAESAGCKKNSGTAPWKIAQIFKLVERRRADKVKSRMIRESPELPAAPRRKLPRSFKDLTPAKHFNPRTFFQELVWKGWFTPRHGRPQRPIFPRLKRGQVAVTWIGHASFLIQFSDLNVLVDPNFGFFC
jgi:hypothetical protein